MGNNSGLWNASFGEIGATLKILQDNGITLEDLTRIRSDKQFAKKVVETIKEKKMETFIFYDEILLTVDFSKSIEEMIKNGHFNSKTEQFVEEKIPSTFDKKEEVYVKLFHFDYEIHFAKLSKIMNSAGYRQGVMRELLTLDIVRPDLTDNFSVVALGSYWSNNGYTSKPCLGLDSHGIKRLSLFTFDEEQSVNFYFLGVHK